LLQSALVGELLILIMTLKDYVNKIANYAYVSMMQGKLRTHCTCGEKMKDNIFAHYYLPYCTNKNCQKYLLLQASEIEE